MPPRVVAGPAQGLPRWCGPTGQTNYLHALLGEFVAETGSTWGGSLLEDYDDMLRKFWLVKPKAAELASLLDALREAA